jgi:hypothetical protein
MTLTFGGGARALLVALALAWVRPGAATTPTEHEAPGETRPASSDDQTLARALFERARTVQGAGRASEACPIFEESLRLEADLVVRFHLAACYEAIGRLASAHRSFSQVAALGVTRGEPELGSNAERRAAALAPRLSKLRVVVAPSEAGRITVERDGTPLDVWEWSEEVPVDPGLHRVRASGDGLVEWSAEIEVSPGPGSYWVRVPPLAIKRLVPQLLLSSGPAGVDAAPPDHSFLGPTHRKVAVLAGGVGVVCIAVGGVFGVRAITKSDASARAGCVGNVCPTPAGVELRREAQVAGNVATVGMISGLTGLATAAAIFLLIDGTSQRPRSVVPRASARSGELLWQGEF